ncbi:MAG: hypothetical protein Q8867_08145, partial [Bacteroidota bacterium]|nr:hypothetical protein [Bacteroidota bacterium]
MKKFTIAAFCLLLGLLLGFNISGKGQILLEENFDYTAGDLITAHGWTAHSGSGTNPITITSSTLTYPGYVSSGTGNEVTLTTSGEDDNHTFVSQTSGTIYASFLVKITSASTTGDYFFHLGPSPISTIFVARFFAKRDASNNLAFGISQTNGAANYTGFAYSLNTTYLVIIKYTINSGSGNDAVSVFINPTLGASEPSPTVSNTDTPNDPVNIGAVALRQGSSSNAPGLKLDGIRIGQSWSDVASLAIVAPTLQASNISFGSITTSGMNVNWTNGDGSKRIVIMNTSNSFTNPVDGNDPSANTVYNGSGEQVIYNGSSNSVAVTGLNSNTTYWYRIFECNGTGTNTKYLTSTATGNPNSQASAGSPAAVTNAATALTTTSATLNGIVNAHGLSTTVNFDWGLTTAYGNNITAAESPVSGFADSPVTAAVSGLTPNTLYHFRVV